MFQAERMASLKLEEVMAESSLKGQAGVMSLTPSPGLGVSAWAGPP